MNITASFVSYSLITHLGPKRTHDFPNARERSTRHRISFWLNLPDVDHSHPLCLLLRSFELAHDLHERLQSIEQRPCFASPIHNGKASRNEIPKCSAWKRERIRCEDDLDQCLFKRGLLLLEDFLTKDRIVIRLRRSRRLTRDAIFSCFSSNDRYWNKYTSPFSGVISD